MRIDVFTIFPGMIEGYAGESILGRAQTNGLLDLRTHDIRDAAVGPHRSVDDAPFGGGAGMVLMAEPVVAIVEKVHPPKPIIYMGPAGQPFTQGVARELAAESTEGFSLLCGRYEGVDQRALDAVCDRSISVGDYVLAGGELAALVVIEAVARMIPGVLGNEDSVSDESFTLGLLEYPHYTRPADFNGQAVPDILLSGDHSKIARWRYAQSLATTLKRRPDLITRRGGLTSSELAMLDEWGIPHADATEE